MICWICKLLNKIKSSNGFKCRIATDPNVAETYIYIALAEHPFVTSTDNGSIPGVAR